MSQLLTTGKSYRILIDGKEYVVEAGKRPADIYIENRISAFKPYRLVKP